MAVTQQQLLLTVLLSIVVRVQVLVMLLVLVVPELILTLMQRPACCMMPATTVIAGGHECSRQGGARHGVNCMLCCSSRTHMNKEQPGNAFCAGCRPKQHAEATNELKNLSLWNTHWHAQLTALYTVFKTAATTLLYCQVASKASHDVSTTAPA